MWAPAGPSWLAEHQPMLPPPPANIIPTQSSIDYSPPTKWPRATTPIDSRPPDSLQLGTSADSGLGLSLSFNSPPIVNNRVDPYRMSPGLRTPTSRPGIHLSATPSPFRSFRLSFASPTFSDRALRLSNSENVVGFRFRGGTIEKPRRINEMAGTHDFPVLNTPVNRCLQMPSTSDDCSPDKTLPMFMGDIFDPQEIESSMTDDSGLFGIDINLHATSTPLPQSPQPFLSSGPSIPPVHNPYADVGMVPVKPGSPVLVTKNSPPTPSSFKRAMRDVQRQGILQPRKLLTDNIILPPPAPSTATEPVHVHHCSKPQVNESKETVKRKRESSLSDSFEVPKKPLKPYSRRWMRLVTGGTRIQRDMTAAAHAFLDQLPRFKDSW
nr:Protein TCL-2 [Haemonchus contortus]